ncbi:hypothetical protein PT274_03380 [Leuconostocaceae bacterium ESL0958]|nr:hypothetical protein [Leuconostocaceae bacterium ESL0958]
MHEITINDLRRLGRLGNVTGRLNNGRQGELRQDGFYYRRHDAIIGGLSAEVKFRISYRKAIGQIQILKQGTKLIATRQNNCLVATIHYDLPKAPRS